MSKFKTCKLLAVSLLAVTAVPSFAAEGGVWVDFSDPTMMNSNVGLGAGTEGVDVYASLAGYFSGQLEQKLTVEAMHDMSYTNVNYMLFDASKGTGFTLDTRWDDEYNQIAIGAIKKLEFAPNPAVNVYPAMKFGHMWDWDGSFNSTTYVEVNAAIRYSVGQNLWFGVTPNYRYALNGLDINDVDATVDVGFQLAEEVLVAVHANNDEELWANFTFAF